MREREREREREARSNGKRRRENHVEIKVKNWVQFTLGVTLSNVTSPFIEFII